jgi:hypothetical protein
MGQRESRSLCLAIAFHCQSLLADVSQYLCEWLAFGIAHACKQCGSGCGLPSRGKDWQRQAYIGDGLLLRVITCLFFDEVIKEALPAWAKMAQGLSAVLVFRKQGMRHGFPCTGMTRSNHCLQAST